MYFQVIQKDDWPAVRRNFQKLESNLFGPVATPTFGGLTLTKTLTLNNLTASRLMATNADKGVISSDLAGWVAGTTNRVTVADDVDGSITLSTPQDIHTGASPTFAGLTLTGLINIGGDILPDTDGAYDIGHYYDAPVPGLVDSYNTGHDSQYAFYGSTWAAQTWTTTATYTIESVKLRLYRIGTPGDITMNIQGTTAGKPGGSTVATCTISGNAITTDTDGEWIEFDLGDGAALDTATVYAIVMSGGVDVSNRVTWKSKLTGTYADGSAMYTENGGTLWNLSNSDCMFETHRGNDDDFRRIKDIYLTGDITDGINATSAAEIAAAYAHISNNGSDHSYIDQSVTTEVSPTFKGIICKDSSDDIYLFADEDIFYIEAV